MVKSVINPLTGRKIQVGGATYNKVFNKKGKGKWRTVKKCKKRGRMKVCTTVKKKRRNKSFITIKF